jgi:chromosome segregation ATPase
LYQKYDSVAYACAGALLIQLAQCCLWRRDALKLEVWRTGDRVHVAAREAMNAAHLMQNNVKELNQAAAGVREEEGAMAEQSRAFAEERAVLEARVTSLEQMVKNLEKERVSLQATGAAISTQVSQLHQEGLEMKAVTVAYGEQNHALQKNITAITGQLEKIGALRAAFTDRMRESEHVFSDEAQTMVAHLEAVHLQQHQITAELQKAMDEVASERKKLLIDQQEYQRRMQHLKELEQRLAAVQHKVAAQLNNT